MVVLALLIANLLSASSQEVPRFTMSAQPSDVVKAELFELATEDRHGQAERLLIGESGTIVRQTSD
ncbi:hypothetical protein BH10PSE1_BH10PSE1_32570 [soil metagenome]